MISWPRKLHYDSARFLAPEIVIMTKRTFMGRTYVRTDVLWNLVLLELHGAKNLKVKNAYLGYFWVKNERNNYVFGMKMKSLLYLSSDSYTIPGTKLAPGSRQVVLILGWVLTIFCFK